MDLLKEWGDFDQWWADNYYELFGAATKENGFLLNEYYAASIAWKAAVEHVAKTK